VSTFAIDPGNKQSAFVRLGPDGQPFQSGKVDNEQMLYLVRKIAGTPGEHLAIEMIASYGMPVGAEVFETCVWTGRFVEAWQGSHSLVFRRDVKLHICGQTRAKDGNVRQALLDRWGGQAMAKGTKRAPGPLYGFKADVWQALALAVTVHETRDHGQATHSQAVSA
jgi:hypothetical protein